MKSERDILVNIISAADQMYRGFTAGDGFIFTISHHWKNSNQPQFILDKLRDALDDAHEFAKSNKINITEFKGDWQQVGNGKPSDPTIGSPSMKGRRWKIDPYGSGKSFPKITHPEQKTKVLPYSKFYENTMAIINEAKEMKYKEFFKEEVSIEVPNYNCPCGCVPNDMCDNTKECMCECASCGCGQRNKEHNIDENKKWIQASVHQSRKGMLSGKNVADLEKMKTNLKKKNASHKDGVPHKSKVAMSQINFALRAKKHSLDEHEDEFRSDREYPAAQITGEDLYVDFDEDSGMWCVFGTESGHAYSSHSNEDDTKRSLDRINGESGGTD